MEPPDFDVFQSPRYCIFQRETINQPYLSRQTLHWGRKGNSLSCPILKKAIFSKCTSLRSVFFIPLALLWHYCLWSWTGMRGARVISKLRPCPPQERKAEVEVILSPMASPPGSHNWKGMREQECGLTRRCLLEHLVRNNWRRVLCSSL